ncbi:nitrilase-related carbon-nitrogen hydrolase [Pseudomonas sp. NPDC089407]|uniref:nitrilase-related carbon-nitrogen hydrolase n=1 Tax=Pseudomonas sp. NPDC089407 TaxID=3364464 RepID=UPI00384E4A13
MSDNRTPVSPVRIAVIQYDPQVGLKHCDGNLSRGLVLAERAVRDGANLIVLPELANTGYTFQSRAEAYAHAETLEEGRSLQAWTDFAVEHQVYLAAGFAEREGLKLVWGWTLAAGSWQPTFVAFVSLPAAFVLLFGGGWQVTISGALLGALLVTPASLIVVNYLCYPLQLPAVVGNVSGMALASILAFILCKLFSSWGRPSERSSVAEPVAVPPDYGVIWTLRRVLADFSEAPFFGNELASLGLLLGALLAYQLAPEEPAYGSLLLMPMIAGQFLASLVGVVFWRQQWRARSWYPTYIPIVSIVPATVLAHGGNWQVVVTSAVLGALVAPPLAAAISQRLPGYMHGYIGNVMSMAICTLAIVPLVGVLAGGGL